MIEIRQHRDSLSVDLYYDFHLGNDEKRIPKWSNDKVGRMITERFMTNQPDVEAEDWTMMDEL
ncbi:DUF2268 domain-containing protein [Rossellomorea aquimaris]|uniref:DUF2268 domain-containing protein n=1 Tax=Rossellomorea aquimaris TaxID=189382 RepID=UPI001CD3F7A3|nr:DUF2268 domain-containing protein [Rossellomorea aquimaris]MCA1054137.1 DUF2268 domain-containing protein [Rossellomorea aquimaris]